jgi:hypothetical protein
MEYGGSGRLEHIPFKGPLGLVPGTKSKLEDAAPWGRSLRSALPSTVLVEVTCWSSVFRIPHGHRPPSAACLGSQPWMAEEIMKPLLHFGSFRVVLLFSSPSIRS